MSVSLMHLQPVSDPVYLEAERLFKAEWNHPFGKRAQIQHIFYIKHLGAEAQSHLGQYSQYYQSMLRQLPGQKVEEYLFNGTKRACHTGDTSDRVVPCNKPDCNMCHIIKCSFSINHAKASGMFGSGIYTTSVASKADRYFSDISETAKTRNASPNRVVLLSNVVVGRTEYRNQGDPSLPKPGYHSVGGVKGVTATSNGGKLKNPETVVYRKDAVCPSVLVVYKLVR